ncbi:MAG: chromate resistance protein [Nitrososphaerota archaeon]|jgi:hypothetical protein|nr:chromate resistance protein [Nitrososphaerota archaeon]MDG7038716.1 chromate resistance protein [Nitrososphaerota archaeon]MDG7040246.1 chromate resistance protein [Nitrososphaerota archaeon]MDG7043446.1 chromate resistance protein [Nitrososphaerota archaeon]MDG7046866.1 chromate resistance protein [Nitrososphaerota archaeon]
MKWITREKAKVDRIACPWLISRFIDEDATFIFVPMERVMEIARTQGAIPFDVQGAELTHFKENGYEFVSFDAIMRRYRLDDPALFELARIVRGADAKVPDAPPESAGLQAIANGFRLITKDDLENIQLQFPAYDALYAYCKEKRAAQSKSQAAL